MTIIKLAKSSALAFMVTSYWSVFAAVTPVVSSVTPPTLSAAATNRPTRIRPDQIPVSRIGSLIPSAVESTNPVVRIEGVLLDQGLGEYVVVQDDTGSLRAETRETTPIGGGERVSVWGRLYWDGDRPFLRNAAVRPMAWDAIAEQQVVAAPGKPDHLPTLTQVRQIRDLLPAQAAWKYPVRVHGIVTTVWRDYASLFVQDETAGIFVAAAKLNLTNWFVGAEVDISGVSGPGGYAPVLEAESGMIVGRQPLPVPRQVTLYQMAMGQFDAQWVEVRGVVRSAQVSRRATDLELSDINGLVEVDIPGGDTFTNLIDSLVRVRGVCGSRANPNRQLTGAYIWAPATNLLTVLEVGVSDPFKLPAQPIAALSRFTQGRALQHWLKVSGVVTFSQPGRPVFVQDLTGGVPVYFNQAPNLVPGDRVEVVGFLSPADFGFALRDANVRVKGHGPLPTAKPVALANVLNPGLHGVWVGVKALVLSSDRRGTEDMLTLKADNSIFEALRPSPGSGALDSLPPDGSTVELQGVYSILGNESRMPRALRLYVPSTQVIRVVEHPAWWNARHASAAAGILVLAALLAASWAITLRRRLRQQTMIIRDRLAAETALEQQYREIFESANDIIFTFDLRGRLTSLNPAGQRALGYTAKEVTALDMDQILAPGSRHLERRMLETKSPDGSLPTCECEFISKEGRRLVVETSLRLTRRNGKAHSVQAIGRNVTDRKRAESALAEASLLLQTLLDNTPDCIYFKDRDSKFVRYSKSFERLFNMKDASTLRGKSDFDFFTDEHARPAFEDEQKIIQTGKPLIGKLEKETHPDGRVTWALTTKMAWRDERGVIIGTFGTSKDVTSIKETEDRLAYEQHLLETLLDNSPDYIYFKDCNSKFVRVSQSLAKMLKVQNPEQLFGKTDFDFYTEGDARQSFEDERRIIATGQPLLGKLERHIHAGGAQVWVLTTKLPWFDKDNKVIGTFGISKDITAIKQAEAELAYERELFRTLLETLPDSIYFKDQNSRFVRVSRSKGEMTLALVRHRFAPPPGQPLPAHLASGEAFAKHLVGKTDFDTFDEKEARAAEEEEREIMRTGSPVIGKLEHYQQAGKWMLVTKMPWRNEQGTVIGTFGVSRDITALKEAEAKLEAVHQRLLETSRQAGMAEVATDVLHNVGNVLNSVNVSCTLTLDRVKASKISSLTKVTTLLNENRSRLGEFVTSDPRGQQIPEFLAALSEHLGREQTSLLTELEQLVKHIDHIKQIVAMQQNYAKVAGVLEHVSPTQLVEDALHINAAALVRHDVQVSREFESVPDVLTEKHKVLQILVNLIRNAKYAMDDSGRDDKHLSIRITNEPDNRVKIQVIDNGVGIPKENLTRIFSHGFTTRRNGHGFGLHSSALAVRELGGSLEAFSEGPNTGARFTLILPLAPPNQAK